MIILGIDFLRYYKATLNLQDQQIIFNPENYENLSISIPIIYKEHELANFQQKSNLSTPPPQPLQINYVTPSNKKQYSDLTQKNFNMLLETLSQLTEFSSTERQEIIDLFIKYKDAFSEEPGLVSNYQCKLHVKAHEVYRRKSYPIPFSKRKAAQEEIEKMLSLKIIEPSHAEYSSPLVCVTKKDGSVCLCLDARNLNNILVCDRESPSNIDEILQRFHGTSLYSVFDMTAGYWQILVHPDSRDYLSFLFNGKNYRFVRLPFGLKHSMATFIKCTSQLLQDEDCILYVDYGIVASPDLSHHLITLANIFEKLICNNIKLRPSKCEFFKKQVKFLGHIISPQGISQDPEKLAAIKQIPPPKTRQQLQKFLGFLQYYRKFSSKLSFYTSRLRHVLSSTKPWKWTAHE